MQYQTGKGISRNDAVEMAGKTSRDCCHQGTRHLCRFIMASRLGCGCGRVVRKSKRRKRLVIPHNFLRPRQPVLMAPSLHNVRAMSSPTRQGWQTVAGASFGGKADERPPEPRRKANLGGVPESPPFRVGSEAATLWHPSGVRFFAPWYRWSAPFALADAPATFLQPSGLRHRRRGSRNQRSDSSKTLGKKAKRCG